jgi:hypothetical protein
MRSVSQRFPPEPARSAFRISDRSGPAASLNASQPAASFVDKIFILSQGCTFLGNFKGNRHKKDAKTKGCEKIFLAVRGFLRLFREIADF